MGVDLDYQLSNGNGSVIDRDVLMLPEIVADDLDGPPSLLLKPSLDLVWNACGYSATPHINSAGKWIGRPR